MKICVIGAGPAGSFAAYLLAKAGHDVSLLEEHKEIGKPVQCSGLVTQSIRKIDEIFSSAEFDNLVVNKIKKVRLYSRNNSVELELSESNVDLVLDRTSFDRYLATKAKEAGARVGSEIKFLNFEKVDDKFIIHVDHKGKTRKIEADVLIGADGHFSSVAKSAGLKSLAALPCIQADMEVKMPSDTMDIYFSSEFADLFAWIVPKNPSISEIGIGTSQNVGEKFNKFIQEREIKKMFLKHTGGPITLYNPLETRYNEKEKIYIIGDAAGHVKATTLGGIIPSLRAAKALSSSLQNGTSFEKETSELKKELDAHNRIRKILSKFSDADYDSLLEIVKKEKVKNILENESRDEFSNSKIIKLLFAAPSLLKFASKAF